MFQQIRSPGCSESPDNGHAHKLAQDATKIVPAHIENSSLYLILQPVCVRAIRGQTTNWGIHASSYKDLPGKHTEMRSRVEAALLCQLCTIRDLQIKRLFGKDWGG